MTETKHLPVSLILKADQEEGTVQAVFSTFNVLDKDGDIVMPTAFTHGQAVPMVWHHDWASPVGKGVIRVEETRAVFDGAFFMDTQAGQEAYKTVKAMGELQEWSWGFRITDAAYEQRDGEFVRLIKRATLFEVSPVLVGAGEGTYTLAIKSHQTFVEQAEAALATVQAMTTRATSLADLRAKEGRVLSEANRQRLTTLRESITTLAAELDDLLAAAEPAKATDAAEAGRLFAEYQRTVARLNGAAV